MPVSLVMRQEHPGEGPGKLTKLKEAEVRVTFQFNDSQVILADTIHWLAFGKFKLFMPLQSIHGY